jgi:3',5'-cyclic AMP phosphodiesterase CpdA
LEDLEISVGDNVASGQPIGKITQRDYTGRFPDEHPFGTDDSHLHFEIRTFYDGGTIFPNFPDCNTGYIPGVGYTYPILPDTLGYLDPIEFLESRVTPPDLEPQYYLPTVHYSGLPCQNGQSLITHSNTNGSFEYPVTDPNPWFEITTHFALPNTYYYNFVQNDPFLAHWGNHYAFLGNQVLGAGRIVDEEMPQSFRLPDNVDTLDWVQYLWLEQTGGSPLDYGTEFGDQFILALKDAETGHSLISDVIIDHTSQDYLNFVWLWVKVTISNAGSLSNRLVSTSYSSLTDGDVIASTMRIDDVSFITYCGGGAAQPEPPGGIPTLDVIIEPIE